MAWMKVDHWLPTKPEVIRLKLLTKSSLQETIGRLVLVWIWFSEQTVTGQSRDCPATVDDVAGHQGFYSALKEVGWLVSDCGEPGTMRVPNFDRWLGSALEARRRQKNRAAKRVPGQSQDSHVTVRSQTQTQTQKKKKTPPPPLGVPASKSKKPLWAGTPPPELRTPDFDRAWLDWLAYRREEIRKPVTQRSGDMALAELAAMGAPRAVAAIKHTIAKGWQGIREAEVPRNGHAVATLPAKAQACARCGTTAWSSLIGKVCQDCFREAT